MKTAVTWSKCSSLPGCYSQGETVKEALQNIKEAIELHVESTIAHGEEAPDEFSEPIQVVTV
jgi:predicted RNase H-like HicB family nuclease